MLSLVLAIFNHDPKSMKCNFQLVDQSPQSCTFVCMTCGRPATAPDPNPRRIHRRCTAGQMPHLARRAANFSRAVSSHILSGFATVSPDTHASRMEHCESCELYTDGWCAHPDCGCTMRVKAQWADQTCPIGKWGAVTPWVRYVTMSDLVAAAAAAIAIVPHNVDAICAIPRSGIVPASVLAMAMHKPLYAVGRDGSLACLNNGRRSEFSSLRPSRLLLVDDTVHSGATMTRVRQSLDIESVSTYAAFCRPEASHAVDCFSHPLPSPHVLEWNIYNCPYTVHVALDMDGIICEDCQPEYDDDGDAYRRWLHYVRPLHLPRYEPCRAIITARLEKYREQTEEWLRRWGVRYDRLIMGPWRDNAERSGADVGHWKAWQLKQLSGVHVYIESSRGLAQRISKLVPGIHVICPDAGGSV